MKEMTFLSGLLVALGMSILVKLGYPVVSLLLGSVAATQVVMAGCLAAYLWAVAALCPKRSGRLVCTILLPAVECGLLLIPMPSVVLLCASLVLLWIGRITLMARGALDAAFDGFLVCVAAGCMAWTLIVTGSPALLTWSFFLVLAARPLMRILALEGERKSPRIGETAARETCFEKSHVMAQRALARLVG